MKYFYTLFEDMCSSYSVIWKFIQAQAKKKKSAPENQAAEDSLSWLLLPGTVQGSQGPDFHSQQQSSLLNTKAGKRGLKSLSQSSVILELLM